jgi:hypothetical protein
MLVRARGAEQTAPLVMAAIGPLVMAVLACACGPSGVREMVAPVDADDEAPAADMGRGGRSGGLGAGGAGGAGGAAADASRGPTAFEDAGAVRADARAEVTLDGGADRALGLGPEGPAVRDAGTPQDLTTTERPLTPDAATPDAPDRDAPVDLAQDSQPRPLDAPGTLGNGLAGHWRLDESTGSMTADSTGANPGALMNTPIWLPAADCAPVRFANPACLELNAATTNQHVSVTTTGLPTLGAPMTIALWVRWAGSPAGAQNFVALGNSAGARLQVGFRGGNLAVWKRTGTLLVQLTQDPPSGWHHVAYVFDGTTHHLFVDGRQRATSGVAPDVGIATALRFGLNPMATSEPFKGRLDDVRIYNRAIEPFEVEGLAAGFDR